MIIHSVAPLDCLMPQAAQPELVCKTFGSGFIYGQDSAEGFVISRVVSTDPAVYLKNEFTPGSAYTGKCCKM